MNTAVDIYINENIKYMQELQLLRSVLLEFPLDETIKWKSPVYVYKGKNLMGLAAFKNYVGLWFFQGSFLKDEKKVLVNAQEGKTKALRQWRFNNVEEISLALVKEYISEAIINADNGKELKPKKNTKPLIIPNILQSALDENIKLKEIFDTFSTSKKREFANHIIEAKREATKLKRLEKIIPMILQGKGLYDKYKNC